MIAQRLQGVLSRSLRVAFFASAAVSVIVLGGGVAAGGAKPPTDSAQESSDVLMCNPPGVRNVDPPTIWVSGPGQELVGSTLSTTPGNWQGCPSAVTELHYQWLRDGGAIGGATGTSYAIGEADAGHRLRSLVTACNDEDCGSAQSWNDLFVATSPSTPTNLSPPDGQLSSNGTPTLSAMFHDRDGQTGYILFEVYEAGGPFVWSGGGNVVGSGQTSAVTISGGGLAFEKVYEWYATAVDSQGVADRWPPRLPSRSRAGGAERPGAGLRLIVLEHRADPLDDLLRPRWPHGERVLRGRAGI